MPMPPRFRTVIFDCDSTLSRIEGIEELARDHRAEVTELTGLAMAGAMPLEQVYGRRLELVRPSRVDLERVGALYVTEVVSGAAEVVRALHSAGVVVQVLSGGLTLPVVMLARHLGIPDDRVAAVDVRFDVEGRYAGFDAESPLARSGGKRLWLERHAARLPSARLLVGDGATDLEARPAVDCFAAFAGVVHRPEVVRLADVVIRGSSLDPVLDLVLPGR
jgi:phosphoserine phosphatase